MTTFDADEILRDLDMLADEMVEESRKHDSNRGNQYEVGIGSGYMKAVAMIDKFLRNHGY